MRPREVILPLLVYLATVYALASVKPESMFDRRSGMPRPFGVGAVPGTTTMPFWLAALMAALVTQHLAMPRE